MKRLALLVALVGCAHRQAPTPSPLSAAACKSAPVRDETGADVPFMLATTCPVPAGVDPGEMEMVAKREGAQIAVLLKREAVFVARPDNQGQGTRTINMYFSPGKQDPAWQAMIDAGVPYFMAAQSLTPAQYSALRARADVLEEDRVYGACKSLLLDTVASAAQPERATACSRTMEVIDRARDRRQAQANSDRMADIEQQRADIEVAAARHARFKAGMDAIEASRPVHTNCQRFGAMVRCTTH